MDWTRGRTIGRGSSAAVSIATSHQSGDVYAVKSVELSQSQFLQREQKILSSLSSPHIVSYVGCDISRENNKDMYNLLMEYVPGGTLFDAIQASGGRLDEQAIGCYTRQVVQGIEYLHSRGIVHCDIKGMNILIGEKGAKIADLGCARWANEVAPIGGTPMFMAPEVARGEKQGFPADIWALGCTIIEMATGGSPWLNSDTDPLSILYRISFSGELPKHPNSLSDQAKDFLSKCLNRDATVRWTAKQLLNHPFLDQSDSPTKQNQNFDTTSPTSILDQCFWNAIGEESETLGDAIAQTSSLSSAAQRIEQLARISGKPTWKWNENWITIRSSDGYGGDEEGKASCGVVVTADEKVGEDMELELECTVGGGEEGLINFIDTNVTCCSNNSSSNRSSDILLGCTCLEQHRVVLGNLNFERQKQLMLFNHYQFL